jgi:Tol biopolymer transport system component
MPNISKDGREIVFTSNRAGGQGAFDIWSSTRASVLDPWTAPTNLGPAVNGPGPETRPSLSWDGSRLYFGRSGEIYLSNR